MKVRNGFVSNSSSSNFIIKLDVVPTSEHHLEEILGVQNYDNLSHWGDYINKKVVINTIYEDIKRELEFVGEKTTINDIDLDNEIYIYNEDDVYEYEKYIPKDKIDEYYMLCNKFLNNKVRWDSNNKFNNQISWSMSNILLEQIVDLIKMGLSYTLEKDSKFIKLTYADEDGQIGGYIEHSDILNPITFKKFNHH